MLGWRGFRSMCMPGPFIVVNSRKPCLYLKKRAFVPPRYLSFSWHAVYSVTLQLFVVACGLLQSSGDVVVVSLLLKALLCEIVRTIAS